MSGKMFFRFVLSLVCIGFILAACSTTPPASLPDKAPDQVVKDFYAWYLEGSGGGPKDARESSMLSADLVTRIEEMMQAPVPGDMISFVCAQDFPNSVEVTSSEIEGDQALVIAQTSFGTQVNLDLKSENGKWLINSVTCVR